MIATEASCLEVVFQKKEVLWGNHLWLGKKAIMRRKNLFFFFSFFVLLFFALCFCRRRAKLQGERIKKIIFPPTTLEGPETKQLSPTHLYSECFQKCLQTITQILQHSRQEYFVEMKNLGQHSCGV